MKSTSFCYCLAILIVALPNDEVQGNSIRPLASRYPGLNEQNKITNTSTSVKISSTKSQPSNSGSYDRWEPALVERQDTKRRDIESSTTKYQNSQRSNVNVATERMVTTERDTSTQLDRRPASPNQNWRPSGQDQASGAATNAQTSRNATRSKPVATKSPSNYDPQITSSLPTGVRSESTTISATERRAPSTSPSASTTTKFGSRSTTAGLVTSSTGRSSSTTVDLRYSSSTESSATKAGKTKEPGDGVNFPASTSTRATTTTVAPLWSTSSGNGNAIPSGFSTTLAPSINGTSKTGNTTDEIDHKTIVDAPPFGCKPGERKDEDNECRKIL